MAVLPPDPVFVLRGAGGAGGARPPVHSLATHFLPGVERLLAGCGDGQLHAYNLQTNRVEQKIRIGQSSILNVHHSDYTLITQEKGGRIKFFQLTESGYVEDQTLEFNHSGFCRFEVSPKLERLYVPVNDALIDVLNFSGEKITSLKPETDSKLGEAMCFKHFEISENPFLLVGYEAGDLLLWDLKTSRCVNNIKLNECPMSVDLDVNTLRGLWGSASDVIQVFSLGRKDLTLTHKSDITIKNAGVNKVTSRSDGKVFVSGGWDGRLRIFSWKTLRPLAVLAEHRGAIQDVIYTEQHVSLWKANIMAAGGLDGSITLWDLYK